MKIGEWRIRNNSWFVREESCIRISDPKKWRRCKLCRCRMDSQGKIKRGKEREGKNERQSESDGLGLSFFVLFLSIIPILIFGYCCCIYFPAQAATATNIFKQMHKNRDAKFGMQQFIHYFRAVLRSTLFSLFIYRLYYRLEVLKLEYPIVGYWTFRLNTAELQEVLLQLSICIRKFCTEILKWKFSRFTGLWTYVIFTQDTIYLRFFAHFFCWNRAIWIAFLYR